MQVHYVSLAKLHKLVQSDQLPEELGGQLPYQHKQWVKNRLVLTRFSISSHPGYVNHFLCIYRNVDS